MATVKRSFFVRAFDDTAFYSELPEFAEKAFSLYVMMDGEATFICSLSPASYGMGLGNVFSCKRENGDKLKSVLDMDYTWEHESVDNDYFSFARHADINPQYVSSLIEFEVETDDEIKENEPLPDHIHNELWEEAFEYFSANSHEPSCCNYF